MTREIKPFTKANEHKEKDGRSTVDITCPYCSTTCTAFVRSLYANGKRCPGCGAVHKPVKGGTVRAA